MSSYDAVWGMVARRGAYAVRDRLHCVRQAVWGGGYYKHIKPLARIPTRQFDDSMDAGGH